MFFLSFLRSQHRNVLSSFCQINTSCSAKVCQDFFFIQKEDAEKHQQQQIRKKNNQSPKKQIVSQQREKWTFTNRFDLGKAGRRGGGGQKPLFHFQLQCTELRPKLRSLFLIRCIHFFVYYMQKKILLTAKKLKEEKY